MNSPCKDCPDRHAHCHSACNRYGEYAAMLEKIRAQRLADAAADAADAERGIKIRRDVRKYGLYKTGYIEKKQCLMVKSVCDFANETKGDDYQSMCAFSSASFVYFFLKHIY